MKICIGLWLGLFGWSLQVWGLPSSARLYQTKYTYRPSCDACHNAGGGSQLNAYGNAFLKSGRNFQAFEKIEAMDSDGDGANNAQEITAKSNPGHNKSTPKNPGDWLEKIGEIYIPIDDLKRLYPAISQYKAMEGRLNQEQIDRAKTLGVTLLDDDTVPTFYFPLKENQRIGVAQIVPILHQGDHLYLGIAVARDGTVEKIALLNEKKFPKIAQLSFFQEIQGKSIQGDQLIRASSQNNALEERILDGVNRALVSIRVVFSKK